MEIVLLRHGETEMNKKYILQGQSFDSVFTKEGAETVKQLIKISQSKHPEAIFSSPLDRCTKIAEEISKSINVPVIKDDRIKQKSWGKLEGMFKLTINQTYPPSNYEAPENKVTHEEKKMFLPEQGESWLSTEQRVRTFLKEIMFDKQYSSVVIVTHRAIFKVIIDILSGWKENFIFRATPHLPNITFFQIIKKKDEAIVFNLPILLRYGPKLWNKFSHLE